MILQPCTTWIEQLRSGGPAQLAGIYGGPEGLLQERRRAYLQALQRFLDAFGDRPVAIYRAPARISLNPHSDHQGAWVPYGTHARELIAVCAPNPDGVYEVVNTDVSFDELLSFNMDEEIAVAPDAWERGWLAYIEHPAVVKRRLAAVDPKGRTSGRTGTLNYLRAAALRLRHERQYLPLIGLRMALHGDIPQGGGLSSSSALVVATACALNDATGAAHPRRSLAELCGEAEWYVGTRGGSGDHAAMLHGHRAGLTHLCFRPPVGVRGVLYSAFPPGFQLILANSQRRAEKSGSERIFFNRGVFAYRFAFLALHEALRKMGPRLGIPEEEVDDTTYLADVSTERFNLPIVYRLLLSLPEHVTPAELKARFPAAFEAAARGCFGTTDLAEMPEAIPLRGAALYGLGRADRGLVMQVLLARGDARSMEEFGRLMSITHDGDRVTRWNGSGQEPYRENQQRLSDDTLNDLLTAARQGTQHPQWDDAQLRCQPGFYGASIPELDRMVDAVQVLPNVAGAGLMGAGGGGYILVLAEAGDASFAAVRERLEREYYAPNNLEPDVEPWHPVDAAGPARLGDAN